MTKRDLYEIAIKLIGLCCLLIFAEKVPYLMNIKFLTGAQFTLNGISVMIGPILFFLLAIVFIIKGATIAGYFVGDYNLNSHDFQSVAGHLLGDKNISKEARQSTINSQDLLFVAVKVLGLYWLLSGLLEMRLSLLVIGCILVFATSHVVVWLSDKNLAKAISQLGKKPKPEEGSSNNSNRP